MKKRAKYILYLLLFFILHACSSSQEISHDELDKIGSALPTVPFLFTSPLCIGFPPAFVTDFEIRQELKFEEPPARVAFQDALFGTCVVRVTDRHKDIAEGDQSTGLKNEYSRVQSFNANGSLILVRGIEATWYLYDAQTLQPLGQLPIEVEPRWSATDANIIYYLSETRLMSINISTGQQSVVHDFSDEIPGSIMVWTHYEGSPSANGRYWGLMAEDANWSTTAYLIYDIENDKVITSRDLHSWPDDAHEIDSVTISPLGNYFLAFLDMYCEDGQLGTDADPCGLMVYDHNLHNGRGLLRIVGHADLALDTHGREVLVYQDIDSDYISMLDLATGTITPLWSIDFTHCIGCGMHFSGRAFQLPGWVLVSYFDGDSISHMWMDDQIFAIELKPEGRVVRFAHHHSLVDPNQEHDYWAEPHASVNQDFTRVLFTTNWGRSGTGEVEIYMIQLPQNWIEQIH